MQQRRMTDGIVRGNCRFRVRKNSPPAVSAGFSATAFCTANGPALQLNHQRRAGFGAGFLLDQQQHGGGRLHGAAKTKPRRERYAARALRRNVAHIEHDHAEAAALQQQIGDFQHLLEAAQCLALRTSVAREIGRHKRLALAAANPQQSLEHQLPLPVADAGSKLSPASTSAQTSWRRVAAARAAIMTAGASGGNRASDLAERAAWQTSGESVELGNADGDRLRSHALAQQQRGREPLAERRFDAGTKCGGGRHQWSAMSCQLSVWVSGISVSGVRKREVQR